ncbi:MAG: hypothetical protein ACP5VP_00975 [Candidatus Limnocylindrales bacterium]
MTDQPRGPLEVRPNTLRDERAPNTFRVQTGPGNPAARPERNAGGGNMAPLGRILRPQVSVWVYVALAVLAVLVVLFLFTGTP